jgi:predicted glycosyltransferase
VIDPAAFERRGIHPDRLISFRGLKEDVSFRGLDLAAVPPHTFPGLNGGPPVRLLYRPPAEESHYYRPASGDLSLELLRYLARRPDAVVIFVPRYPRQEEYLDRFSWVTRPIVLRDAVPFASLLKSVDLVVSSGGTMAREAAYLGVPAYSIFQGELGAVDRHLASLGRLRLVSSPAEFSTIALERRPPSGVLGSNPHLAEEIAATVLARASRRG